MEYNQAENEFWFTVIDKLGKQVAPDAAPNITITNPSGTELVAATAMTVYAGTTTGYLSYDAQTAEFSLFAKVTDGTSGATGRIVGQRVLGASGVLELVDINGTFGNNNTITDDGEYTGSATADGTLFQADYSYTLDTSATASYGVAKNYCAKITYDLSTIGQVEYVYFDVAFYPATRPWVTSPDVAHRWPHLAGQLPDEWPDWTPAIQAAHAELIGKLDSLGEDAAYFVKRREELWKIAMIFTRAEIADAIGEDQERIDYWVDKAANAWAGRGEFTYDSSQDDTEIDEDTKVIGSSFTR